MTIVIAPFKIVETIDVLVFRIDKKGVNRVGLKPDSAARSKKYKTLPSFQRQRNHAIEEIFVD